MLARVEADLRSEQRRVDELEAALDGAREALEEHGGKIQRAARSLGLSRQALYRRMDKYGIPRR